MTDAEASSAADQGFRVATVVADGTTTVAATGPVDMLTAPPLAAAVEAAQRTAQRGVIVDLTGVDFLGSAGLSVLVEAARRAMDAGSGLVIVAGNHPVLHAIEVTGLDAVLTVVSTLADGEARLIGRGPGPA
jgi:anti-sigma B factor antagonist